MVSTYQLQEDYESSTEWYTLEVRQSEVPLYGSSRLGLHLTDRIIRRYYNDDDENGYDEWDATVPGLATGPITSHSREVGHKAYELPNHLGNVLATVSDRKWPVFSEPKPGKWQFEHFQAELLSVSEYYPFGMEMPGRIASSESYRYGFNGMEKDDEIKGPGNNYTAEFWQYDSRLGRRWNRDPRPNPSISQYVTFADNPVWYVDPMGDTIRLSQSFENSSFLMDIHEKWKQTDSGKEFYRDFSEGGKYGETLVEFDVGKSDVTIAKYRNKETGNLREIPSSPEGLDTSPNSNESLYMRVQLADFSGYERSGPFENDNIRQIQFFSLIYGFDSQVHEPQHVRLFANTILKLGKNYSEASHHVTMGKIGSGYYEERYSALIQGLGMDFLHGYYKDYVSEGSSMTFEVWFNNVIINTFPNAEKKK